MLSFGLYKKILHCLPTAIVVFDKKGRVRFLNAAFRRTFPLGKRDRGKIEETFGGTRERGVRALVSSVFASGEAQEADVSVFLPFSGGEKEISLRMRALPVGKRFVAGLLEGVYEPELKRELRGAQAIQQRLLPVGKEAGGVPYAYTYLPCREVGGDLPDVYEVEKDGKRRTFGLLADVSGHGVSAAMLSSFVKAGIDRSDPSPAGAVASLAAKFPALNLDEKAYITVAAVSIDRAAGAFSYTLAGHNAPILWKNGGGVSEIEMSAPPVSNWFENYPYENGEITYSAGDILVLLTDGAMENRNAEGEQFGIERVENILLESRNARDFIDRLQAELKAFCPVFSDDVTAIAFDL